MNNSIRNDDDGEERPQRDSSSTSSSSSSSSLPFYSKNAKHEKKELDVEKYMASREMTPMQERMNAVTILPGAFYCAMLLLSGAWLSQSKIEDFRHHQYGETSETPSL